MFSAFIAVFVYLVDWRLAVVVALVLPAVMSEDAAPWPKVLSFLFFTIAILFVKRTTEGK